MSDCSTAVRRPYQAAGYEAMVLAFMWNHGHKGYANEIRDLTDYFDEVVAEAGPGGNHCEFTQEKLDTIDKAIMEVIQSAVDRYDDWKTDPLP